MCTEGTKPHEEPKRWRELFKEQFLFAVNTVKGENPSNTFLPLIQRMFQREQTSLWQEGRANNLRSECTACLSLLGCFTLVLYCRRRMWTNYHAGSMHLQRVQNCPIDRVMNIKYVLMSVSTAQGSMLSICETNIHSWLCLTSTSTHHHTCARQCQSIVCTHDDNPSIHANISSLEFMFLSSLAGASKWWSSLMKKYNELN